MDRVEHPDREYSFLPAIPPYSGGVRALDGHRIRRATVRAPIDWLEGFRLIDDVLAAAGRPARSLCAIELRCQEPHSFDGFGAFNGGYREALADRDILLDGVNPVARTNVAPLGAAARGTELHAFSFTVEGGDGSADARPSFVVSGAADVHDQADLRPEAIVGRGRTWNDSGTERTEVVMTEIEGRLAALGVGWGDTDSVVAYSDQAIGDVMESVILPRLGTAAGRRGVLWHLARPPVEELLYEMDARGGVDEVVV